MRRATVRQLADRRKSVIVPRIRWHIDPLPLASPTVESLTCIKFGGLMELTRRGVRGRKKSRLRLRAANMLVNTSNS